MECQYCEKVLKNTYGLKAHHKTKLCLQIQKDKNITQEDNSILVFVCCNCNKEFNSNKGFKGHINKCFIDLVKVNSKFVELTNRNTKLEDENKQLKDEINSLKMQIYDVEIKHLNKNIDMLQEDHQAIIDIAKQPKSLVYNNNINKMLNIMQPLDLKNKDDMKQIIDEKYTLDDIFSGQKGFAKFAYENLLKDENGNLKYICSDPSRQIFKYKTPEGTIHKDVDAKKLTGFLVESGLKDKACNLTEQWLNNENGDSYAHRFEVVIDKAEEIRNIVSDNTEFTKHLIPMTAI